MKFKTTIKEQKVTAKYNTYYSVPYCELQDMFYFFDPIAYNAGVYGWNFDVFNIEGIWFSTGYRYLVGERLKDYRLLDEKCHSIYNNFRKGLITFEEGQRLVKLELYKHLRDRGENI